MNRYIDADRLKADLYNSGYCNNNWLDIEGCIDCQSTADVVEVVRCKSCKYRIYDRSRALYYCNRYYGLGSVRDNNYCSLGERLEA